MMLVSDGGLQWFAIHRDGKHHVYFQYDLIVALLFIILKVYHCDNSSFYWWLYYIFPLTVLFYEHHEDYDYNDVHGYNIL